jgi:hypothetical protein
MVIGEGIIISLDERKLFIDEGDMTVVLPRPSDSFINRLIGVRVNYDFSFSKLIYSYCLRVKEGEYKGDEIAGFGRLNGL